MGGTGLLGSIVIHQRQWIFVVLGVFAILEIPLDLRSLPFAFAFGFGFGFRESAPLGTLLSRGSVLPGEGIVTGGMSC